MLEVLELKWKRTESSEFPRVWHTFKAKDVGSDELVEYHIQDLPESREEEAVRCMVNYFCKDESLCQAYDLTKDTVGCEDLASVWQSINQKTCLVCFKEGSDEIVGLNMNFVYGKDDHFMEDCRKKNRSEKSNFIFDIMGLLYEDFDVYEHYGVDKYLGSLGLIVLENYRGRSLGEHFLNSRRIFCNEFGIKLSSTVFTSNFSNRIADKVGFELNKSISYTDIRNNHPEFKLPPIQSDLQTLKSIQF